VGTVRDPVNWALSRFLKLQLNVVREQVEDLERNPISTGGAFESHRPLRSCCRAIADPQKTFTNDEFEQAIADLGTFARHRGESVTRQVSAARQQ
jgi:hypothetical protein